MATQAVNKPATNRQLAYINRLRADLGEEGQESSSEISSFEASKLIGELIAKAKNNGTIDGRIKTIKINEPRLGMAMKECFRLWKKNGWDIYSKHRQGFIKDAINAYYLFTEIAETMEQNGAEAK